MSIKPITFSAPMVRALLEGTKTQTRRLAKFEMLPGVNPEFSRLRAYQHRREIWMLHGSEEASRPLRVACAAGDWLYVREHWKTAPAYDDLAPSDMGGEEPLRYLADDATFNWGEADGSEVGRHRQAMHMPRWASRLWLEVTEVRVQRLQDISEDDAIAEGIEPGTDPDTGERRGWRDYEKIETGPHKGKEHPHAIIPYAEAWRSYSSLWDTLHTDAGTRWADNPWVVAYTFGVNRGNIDA